MIGTFLYAEEEILYYLAGKYGMTLLYAPEIGCMHKEAVSTNFVMQDFCDAKSFLFREYHEILSGISGTDEKI